MRKRRRILHSKGCSCSSVCNILVFSSFDPAYTPTEFMDILIEWGCTWRWNSLLLAGDEKWIEDTIAGISCMAVKHESYIREPHPDICSAAFIPGYSKGWSKLVGLFPEKTKLANAYRGKLLGIMAIHLIMLSVNKVNLTLNGLVYIFSDCLGVLDWVEYFPPHQIPSRCKHSDILKNILVNCSDFKFCCLFSHVKAHQDDEFHLKWHISW